MEKKINLSCKIAGRDVKVSGSVVSVGATHISLRFASEYQALIGGHCYKGQVSKIEAAQDEAGGYLLVVYKNKEAA